MHLAKRDFPQQRHDDGRQRAGPDEGRQVLRWDATGVGDLPGQQRPAQQGVGGDGVGAGRVAAERADGEPYRGCPQLDAALRPPGPCRAEQHQGARPAAAREFDSEPPAEGVTGDVHLLQAQLVELVLEGVSKGLN